MSPDDMDRDDTAPSAADAAAPDDDQDVDIDDPEFQAVLLYIERFATKVAKEINARHAPSSPATHEPSGAEPTTEAPDEPPTPEPGTDAYDEIHGIPRYDLE